MTKNNSVKKDSHDLVIVIVILMIAAFGLMRGANSGVAPYTPFVQPSVSADNVNIIGGAASRGGVSAQDVSDDAVASASMIGGKEKDSKDSLVPEYDGYIIEFKEEPLLKVMSAEGFSSNSITGNAITVESHRQKLNAEHARVKSNIEKKLGKKVKVKNEFDGIFNGMAVDISDAEAEKIKQLADVKNVYPDMKVYANLMDSVPLIKASDAWNLGYTGNGTTIAIIDTGIDYTHPDLGGCFGPNCKVVGGYDFVNYDSDPMDDQGHGTHCAGIAAGNGALKGVAPDAKLYAYKVLDSTGSGYMSQVIAGIQRTVDPDGDGNPSDHVDVISLSLGSLYGDPNDPQSTVVNNAVKAGVVVVVAAGNNGPGEGTIASPGTARKAITVGATTKSNLIAYFSSRGPVLSTDSLIKPDVVAPGMYICSAEYDSAWSAYKCFDDKHVSISGTSMATPHVAGAAALIKQANPDWGPEEIKMALRNTAVNIGESINAQGYGKINVLDAVNLKQKPLVAELSLSNYIFTGLTSIYGTAKGENLDYYEVQYSPVGKETWNTICRGTSPINQNVLCSTFNANVLSDGQYYLRLLAYDKNGLLSKDMAIFYYDNPLNWPRLFVNTFHFTSPMAGDVDGDGLIEIITASMKGDVYVFNASGALKKGWPKKLWTYETYNTLALGDIDKDKLEEIIIPDGNNMLYVFNGDGSVLSGWPVSLGAGSSLRGPFDPVISDIDKDGKNDIIFNYNSGGNILNVFNGSGSIKKGWPYNYPQYEFEQNTPAVADLDKDNYPEIITAVRVGNSGAWKVYVFNHDGTILLNWPKLLTGEYWGFCSSPVIGDIDRNDELDIVVGCEQNIYALNPRAELLSGWPVHNKVSSLGIESISLFDYNKDGLLELAVSAERALYVLNSSGFLLSGWPVRVESTYVSVGDINGDRIPDLITGDWYNNVSAYDINGKLIAGFPIKSEGVTSAPLLADLNGDKKLELTFGDLGGSFYSYTLNSQYNASTMDWPMLHRDSKHTGKYFKCGDSSIDFESGEKCDKSNLGGKRCVNLGFYDGGSLSCNSTCQFNTSKCLYCGDKIISEEYGEECDGTNLGADRKCANFISPEGTRYYSGTVLCSPECEYDTSNCIATPPLV